MSIQKNAIFKKVPRKKYVNFYFQDLNTEHTICNYCSGLFSFVSTLTEGRSVLPTQQRRKRKRRNEEKLQLQEQLRQTQNGELGFSLVGLGKLQNNSS